MTSATTKDDLDLSFWEGSQEEGKATAKLVPMPA